MKVLQLIQKAQLRGAEIFASQLSQELLNKGISVDIVYLYDGNDDLKSSFPQVNFINLKGNPNRRFFDLSVYRKISQIINKESYSVVQANAGDTLKYAVFSKLIFGWKTPLIFRNANKLSGFIKNKVHKVFIRFLLSKCDFIISVSENCRLDLCSLYAKVAPKSLTIPIGTYDHDNVAAISHVCNEPILINIGSFVPEKNHLFLIDVFAEFYKSHGKGFLWLVGSGKLHDVLVEKVRSLGLSAKVTFWGYRKDAISILKRSDLMIMPSKIEGLPGVILESFSCRVPVIASNVGGVSEVVLNNQTGICINNFSLLEYVESIEKLLNDKAYRSALIDNARNLIDSSYTMNGISGRFISAYRSLLRS